eukprot:383504_1
MVKTAMSFYACQFMHSFVNVADKVFWWLIEMICFMAVIWQLIYRMFNSIDEDSSFKEISEKQINTTIHIISTDSIQIIISHLSTFEINNTIRSINKGFDRLCDHLCDKSYMNKIKYQQHFVDSFPKLFDTSANGKYFSRKYFGFYLQNKYELESLNNSFDELGSVLKGIDKSIWNLSNQFRVEARLIGHLDDDGDLKFMYPMRNVRVSYESYSHSSFHNAKSWPYFNSENRKKRVSHATVTAVCTWRSDGKYYTSHVYPFIQFVCPNIVWRKKFHENIKSNT